VLCGTNFSSIDFGSGLHTSDAQDGYVVLLSPEGELVWEQWIDGPGEQRCWRNAAVDPLTQDVVMSSLFVAEAQVGGQDVVGQGESDILLVRLAAQSGAVTGTRTFGSTAVDRARGLDFLPDGRVVLTAWTEGTIDLGSGPLTNDGQDVIVALLEPNLATVWSHLFASPGDQRPWRPVVTSTGDIILAGSMSGSLDLGAGAISDPDGGFIARLSPSDGLATSSAALPGFNAPLRVHENADGELLVAGGYRFTMTLGGETAAAGFADHDDDPVAVKLSSDFQQVVWKQLASTSTVWEDFTGSALGADSTVFLAGSFNETLAVDGCSPRPSAGDADGFLMKRKP
jgi:hypothetical protein